MINLPKLTASAFLLAVALQSSSQQTAAFNQNASRSNHTRLSFSVSPGYYQSLQSNRDSLSFGGSGAGFMVSGEGFSGNVGIGFSSGFVSLRPSDARINNFMKDAGQGIDKLTIRKTAGQSAYLLLGPSVRWGGDVQLQASLRGGLFWNNTGTVALTPRGAQRDVYRTEPSDKTLYPGLQGGLHISYAPASSPWSIGLGADYLRTGLEVSQYDQRRGTEPLRLSQAVSGVLTGISFRYDITRPHDASTGASSGRYVEPLSYSVTHPRDVSSGMPTGRRTYLSVDHTGPTPRESSSGMPTGRRLESGCGPVVQRITHPDGTVEELNFSCVADAQAYTEKAGKQKAWMTANYRTATSNNTGVIYGRLGWPSPEDGIITNTTYADSGATPSAYGTRLRLQSASTKTATTGVFVEEKEAEKPPVKTAPVMTNPLYNGGGLSGENPLYEGNSMTTHNGCIKGATVQLLYEDGSPAAQTTTDAYGTFFFAHVPEGNYTVKLIGAFLSKKGYDYYSAQTTRLTGKLEPVDDWAELQIGTEPNDEAFTEAVVKTKTKSNQSNDRMIPNLINERIRTKSNHANDRMAGGEDGDAVSIQRKKVLVSSTASPDGAVQLTGTDGRNRSAGLDGDAFSFADVNEGKYQLVCTSLCEMNDEVAVAVESLPSLNSVGRTYKPTVTATQNSQSLRTISAAADVDGDGVFETNITNQMSEAIVINEKGEVNLQQKASMSKSSVLKEGHIEAVSNDTAICYGTMTMAGKEVAVQMVLKGKHDIAMNAIRNLK